MGLLNIKSSWMQALETVYQNAGITDFHRETIFQFNKWSIHAFVGKTGVLEIFWGSHEPCGSSIQGVEGQRFCGLCDAKMTIETETVLADALRMLRDTLVLKLGDDTIVGYTKVTYPILKKDNVPG